MELVVKNLPANTGDTRDAGSVPGSGRYPEIRSGNPLQYSCLENSMDGVAWWATIHRAAKSQTRLSDWALSIYIFLIEVCCYLVAKLCPTMQPHGLQHTRFPCPPLSPEICSSSCPSSRWCYLTISSSAILFSFCHQSFPASGSFPTNRLFTSDTKKYWSLSFSISPFDEYSGLISFRIDWFDLLAVQGNLKSLFQLCNSKASILWCSVFFMVQHSHLYVSTAKTISLTIQTLVGKVMSLFFKMLIEVQLIYKTMLISSIQHSDSVIHIFFRFSSIRDYYKI